MWQAYYDAYPQVKMEILTNHAGSERELCTVIKDVKPLHYQVLLSSNAERRVKRWRLRGL
jgi:hypothetical protein